MFVRDQNSKFDPKKPIEEFQFFKVDNKNDELLLKKVNSKYLHFTNQKIVNYSHDDQ